MRITAPAALAALSFALVSCTETTTPLTQDQVDESVATSIAAAGMDPNAETSGGHTATPPAVSCAWNATTKWTTCTSTQNGLTVTRQMQFLNTAGTPLQFPDTSVRSMKARTTMVGTMTMMSPTAGGPTGTSTVNRTSDETVTGVGPGSNRRVVNGTASGTEDSQGNDARGTMSVKRQYADTTLAMTLSSPPNPTSPFPLSGTIIRNVKASVSVNGAAAKDYTSREVQTFEAGGKLTIRTTMNGQTRTCVIQMPSIQPGSTSPPPKPIPVCTQG